MPKILTYNSSSDIEKKESKGNLLETVWGKFQSLDKFTKFYILAFLLIIVATPFITSQYLNYIQKAAPSTNEEKMRPEEEVKKLTLAIIKASKRGMVSDSSILKMAQERKNRVISLSESNPSLILTVAIPEKIKKNLSVDILPYLEEAVEIEGEITRYHQDFGVKNENHKDYYEIRQKDGTTYSVIFAIDKDNVFGETEIKVKGVKIGNRIIVEDSEKDATVIKKSVLGATTAKKIAVFAINFRDLQIQPFTIDQIRERIFTANDSVSAYYREVTFGKWSLEGKINPDVFGWYTVNYDSLYSSTNCDYTAKKNWASDVKSQAQKDGIDLSGYNNFLYIFAALSGHCGGGQAEMPGSNAWISLDTSSLNFKQEGILLAYGASHELGHNFGLNHSGAVICKDTNGNFTTNSGTCTFITYLDPFDVMGSSANYCCSQSTTYTYDYSGLFHLTNYHKGRLGVLNPGNTLTVSSSGVYSLAPIEIESIDKIQSLRIPLGGKSSAYYYLEFRQPFGLDNFRASDPPVNGIIVRIAPDYATNTTTQLYNMTPGSHQDSGDDFFDGQIAVSKTFEDSARGIKISLLSITNGIASVRVDFGGSICVRVNPTLSISPTSQFGMAGESLNYSFTLTNNDSSACPASTFAVSPNLPAGFSQNPASFSISLSPGASVTQSLTITSSSGTPEGFYSFSEVASNQSASGFSSSASASYNVYLQVTPTPTPTLKPTPTPVPEDTTAPSVSVTNPLNGAILTRNLAITITASASDNTGISKVEFYVNGALKCTDTASPYTCNWKVPGKPNANYTISAKAYDTSNNTSTSAVSVTAGK